MDTDLASLLNETPNHVKIDFLENILEKDPSLEKQFRNFLRKEKENHTIIQKTEETQEINTARNEFLYSKKQAGILLEYLHQTDPAQFAVYGEKIFHHYGLEFSSYILERLNPSINPNLYKELLSFQMMQTRNISLYRLWKRHSSKEDLEKLLEKCKYMPYFYGRILAEEGRFQEIVELMQQLSTRDHSYFGKLLPLIVSHLPQEAYLLVKERIGETLNCYRDRNTYREIIQWLERLKDQSEIALKSQLLIRETFHRKPALPALKDEMLKAGLFNGRNN